MEVHKYRTHNCGELNKSDVDKTVKLSGWVHRRRDHGNLLFIDLRDHYGITQLVFLDENAEMLEYASHINFESVITVVGDVVARTDETVNNDISTGEIEVVVKELHVESQAGILPLVVNGDQEIPEDTRLKYRFLDLRREVMHKNIVLRSEIISEIRNLMQQSGFIEFQTPILTSSSPEGARDFLVPSRIHKGKFYALPQAPQQFKQLLMVSGFDKYFQVAPCFRDEDARADRSPGEFYQLDIEMSFVTQEDIFNTMGPIIYKLFSKFSRYRIGNPPFSRIPYTEAMLKYGTDKPDLRNPIIISDVTDHFVNSDFKVFANQVENGAVVRAIPAPNTSRMSRSFFDKMIEYAKLEGAGGLAYIQFVDGAAKGPIAKFLTQEKIEAIVKDANLDIQSDSIFFACDMSNVAAKIAGKVRIKLGQDLKLLDSDVFKFCWIVDFPFFEWNDQENKIDFSHNPFSMPQCSLEELNNCKTKEDLLSLKAYQYDIVCNGVELSSGAIRNHQPDLMYKVFEIVGYTKEMVDSQFGCMINAFKYGAPPHGGIAPGIDRIVMLLANTPNIREIIAFPLNQKAEDLLMNAPCVVEEKQLRELNIQIRK